MLQLHDFDKQATTIAYPEEGDIVLRMPGNNKYKIDYLPYSELIDTIIKELPDNDDPYDLSDPIYDDDDVDVVLVYDPNEEVWIKQKYWESGGDTTTCYGSAIGDMSQMLQIDLSAGLLYDDNGSVVNLDWHTLELHNGWRMYDDDGKESVDSQTRLLIADTTAPAKETLDWQNKKLIGNWSTTAQFTANLLTSTTCNTGNLKISNAKYAPTNITYVTGVTVDPVTHATTLTTETKTVLALQP